MGHGPCRNTTCVIPVGEDAFPVSSWLFVGDVKWPDGNTEQRRQRVKLQSDFSKVISEGVEPARVHNVFLRLKEGAEEPSFPMELKGSADFFLFSSVSSKHNSH